MTHYVLVLHSYSNKNPLYIMADAIDYYAEEKSGATLICTRGGTALNVAESPEEIRTMLKRITGNISLTDTRSEQERWLNGE